MVFKLIASSSNPPLGALVTAEVVRSEGQAEIDVSWSSKYKGSRNVQLLDKDERLVGESSAEVSRYLARTVDLELYGGSGILERTEVDHWLSFATGPLRCSRSAADTLTFLDRALVPKTWLVAKRITIADIYVFDALQSQDISDLEEKYPNIHRWYKHILSLSAVQTALMAVTKNKTSTCNKTASNSSGTRKLEGKFIELPGTEIGKVVVRFPPEASGYLHIGHAKAALLNQYYAETFQGQLIMRFDDTNPAKETVEFEGAILEDLDMLQIKPDRFTHSSDYFDVMLEYCERLIRDSKAFVDDTPAQLMKEQRDQRLPSVNRDNSIEKNLELWEEMKKGSKRGQECCVRAKIDYQSDNGCMRDPTIYRCKPEPHPRTGTKYKVYPTYDFACPIVDAIEGVTHTLRTTEYHDRDVQFYWVIEALGLRHLHIWEYSRLNMTNTVLSKRKLTWFVAEGLVDGWDDPRFPTVRGILRRGMTVEGLKQFIIAQGSSRSVVFMEWDKIWSFNKKVIDPIAIRYTTLNDGETVPVNVDGAVDGWLTVQNHPKDPAKGTKQVRVGPTVFIEKDDAETLTEGQNATFINWGNLLIQKVKRKDGVITEVDARMNVDDKNYKNTVKLTWLASAGNSSGNKIRKDDFIPCYAVYFEHIINKPVLDKDDDFKNFIAKNTRREIKMLGETELKRVAKGEIIQLQRKGFFRCDEPYAPASVHSSREQPLILFHIPDGHATAIPTATVGVEKVIEKTVAQGKQQLKTVKVNEKVKAVSPDIAKGDASNIDDEISKQGDKIRQLKSAKADKNIIDQEVKILLSLKNDYKAVTGEDWKPPGSSANSAKKKLESNPKSTKTVTQDGQQSKAAKLDKTTVDEQVKTASVKTVKADVSNINNEISKQGDKIRQLKSAKADKNTIDREVKILLSLKNDYKAVTGEDWKPPGSSANSAKKKLESDPKKVDKVSKKPNKIVSELPSKDLEGGSKTGTRLGIEAKKSENLSDWYSQVITKGEMIEYYDVSGCYILRPWSFAIWDIIKDYIDKEIKKLGVQNCYFPIFVSRSVLEKEKVHIADFAPEVAWVTKSGESDLAEPIAIRPTSETVMYPAYAKWLKSHRDLPLKLNQWNNVVRWEFKHPQPFLRTREFLWQEGHSAFATKAEADEEVLLILELYAKVYEDFLAVPVIRGRKTEKEKFAGGDYTTTVEAFILASGRAIQGATSHHLGQNFSKMFDIQVEGVEEGEKIFVYQNSWGLTTRTIGVMIMVHGDDKGLVLPPKVASIQVIIVPCGITASTTLEQRQHLLSECTKLEEELSKENIVRVKGDYRDNYSPGWKFNHWELKGVPLRVELGPKDLKNNQLTLVRRDDSTKLTIPRAEAFSSISKLLEEIQSSMLARATVTLKEHITQTNDWNEFCSQLDRKNLILAPFCGEIPCEDKIKADSVRNDVGEEPDAPSMGAKSLCIPFDQPKSFVPLNSLKCIHPNCVNKPKNYTLFGRSY